jgi:DNA end-binding protein Ku
MLSRHGHCPVSYVRVCRGTDKEIPWNEIVKGYEYEKGDYVILTDEELKKASPKKTKSIEVTGFTAESEIPRLLIEKPYYIEPDKKSEKAYVLLREALKRSKKVGIASIVFRDKEHLAMIKPEGDALLLLTLRYQDELRKPEDLHIPSKTKFSQKELDITMLLIDQLEEHFKSSEHHDEYAEAVKKVVEKKAKGKPIKIKGEPVPTYSDMQDLMDILKKSLAKAKSS